MNKKWNEKTTFEKVLTVISGVALFVWLLFEILERKTSLWFAEYVNYIAVAIICICESIILWKVKRSLSYVGIVGALCMIAVLVLEFIPVS